VGQQQRSVDPSEPEDEWIARPQDVAHDILTCDKPVCVEAARIIRARERSRRKTPARELTYGANQEGS
jgi:hypothetical protein